MAPLWKLCGALDTCWFFDLARMWSMLQRALRLSSSEYAWFCEKATEESFITSHTLRTRYTKALALRKVVVSLLVAQLRIDIRRYVNRYVYTFEFWIILEIFSVWRDWQDWEDSHPLSLTASLISIRTTASNAGQHQQFDDKRDSRFASVSWSCLWISIRTHLGATKCTKV